MPLHMSNPESFKLPRGLKWVFLGGLVAALLVFQLLVRQQNPFPAAKPARGPEQIAVLPFEWDGEATRSANFAESLRVALTGALAKAPGLHVVPAARMRALLDSADAASG